MPRDSDAAADQRVENMPARSPDFPAERRGRAGRGLPRPEPGAGSAGPGAAQWRRLIKYGQIRQRITRDNYEGPATWPHTR
jgi:hypothetical protein